MFALLKDQKAPASVKDYIEGRIRGVATQICRDLRPMDPVLNAYNPIPLGVEMVLVTRDGMTLLRKRGKDVATASGEWDVSFSGYCGDKDIDRRTGELDLGLTAKHELEEEIGTMPAEPTDIRFTGLHRNTVTKAIDVLGYWQVEADTDELVRLITRKHPGKRKVFSTSKRAPEAFVWDTGNVVVNFEASDIASLLSQLQFSDDRSTGGFRFMPEAFASLVLALKACGKPMSEPFC